MLTGRYQAIPNEGENITPSTWETMTDSFKAHYLSPFLITPGADPESRATLQNNVQSLLSEADSGDQGIGQKTANWFAGMAGSILNPYSLIAGEGAAALTSRAISAGAGFLGDYIPLPAAITATAIAQKPLSSIIGKEVPEFVGTATVGGIAKGAVSGFAGATGFMLPENIANTYNPKQNTFNYWGGVKASFADGGVALGLMAVPFLAGSIWGKLFNRGAEEVSHAEMPLSHDAVIEEGKINESHPSFAKINAALENGKITSQEHKWFTDYLSGNLSNEELTNNAIGLLSKDGFPLDAASKKILMKLFNPEEIEQLQTALADSLASNLPENMKPLLKEFMINTKLDQYRDSSKLFDGIQGVVKTLRSLLERAPEDRINLNKILRRLLPENVKEENPFTHAKIYQAEKTGKSLGVMVPKQVRALQKHMRKLSELRDKANTYEKLYKKTNKKSYEKKYRNTIKKLIDAEKSKPRLLSHQEEIEHLRNQLIKENKVKPDFKLSEDYQRLLDLTRVRNDARRLMHELHLMHEHELQDAYATVLDSIAKIMKSNMSNLADKNNMINYMRERIVRKEPTFEKIEIADEVKAVKETNKETVTEPEKKLDDLMQGAPKELQKEFEAINNQFKEFKENPTVFKNLIRCVMGSING